MRANFDNGIKTIDEEPTTDSKIGLEGRFTMLTSFNPFLPMYAPMQPLVILRTSTISYAFR